MLDRKPNQSSRLWLIDDPATDVVSGLAVDTATVSAWGNMASGAIVVGDVNSGRRVISGVCAIDGGSIERPDFDVRMFEMTLDLGVSTPAFCVRHSDIALSAGVSVALIVAMRASLFPRDRGVSSGGSSCLAMIVMVDTSSGCSWNVAISLMVWSKVCSSVRSYSLRSSSVDPSGSLDFIDGDDAWIDGVLNKMTSG